MNQLIFFQIDFHEGYGEKKGISNQNSQVQTKKSRKQQLELP